MLKCPLDREFYYLHYLITHVNFTNFIFHQVLYPIQNSRSSGKYKRFSEFDLQ